MVVAGMLVCSESKCMLGRSKNPGQLSLTFCGEHLVQHAMYMMHGTVHGQRCDVVEQQL